MAELIAASTALGATSSLITIADVAWRTIKRITEYIDNAGKAPMIVRNIHRQLEIFHETIKWWDDETLRGAVIVRDSAGLTTAMLGCSEAIESLVPLIKQLLPKATDSKVVRFKTALKSVKIEPELTKTWAQIESYKTTLILHFVRPGPELKSEGSRSKTHYLYPNRLVSRYIDRSLNSTPITTEIDRHFALGNSEDKSHIVVLRGMGGSGKTQLALRYCDEARSHGRIKAIFWIDTASPSSVASSFEGILSHLTGSTGAPVDASGLNDQVDTTTKTQQTIKLVKRMISDLQVPWMFVFDNFDQPDDFKFHGALRSIRDYWPSDGKGNVLITSRHRGCERLGKTFDVGSMSVEEASQLLLGTTHESPDPRLLDQAKDIVQLLSCLALAVDQAGAYISSQRLDLSQYAKHYRDRKEEVLKCIPKASAWEYSRQTEEGAEPIGLSVFTTWELSLECISGSPQEKEAKVHLLSLAAFYSSSGIQESLFNIPPGQERYGSSFQPLFYSGTKKDSYKFGDVITEFESLSLIASVDRSGKEVQFTIHPLVSDWIRLRLPHDQRNEYFKEAIFLLSAIIPQRHKYGNLGKSVDVMLALLKHFENCVEHSSDFLLADSSVDLNELHDTVLHVAKLFDVWYRLDKARSICETALRWREVCQLPRDRHFLEIACQLMWVLHKQHDMKNFKRLAVQLHIESQALLGDDDRLTLQFLIYVGWMYQENGRHSEAEHVFHAVYSRNMHHFGSKNLSTLVARLNLAILYCRIDAQSQSIFHAEQAFQGLLESQGPSDWTTLMAQKFLGGIYTDSDDFSMFDKALSLVLDCSTRLEKICGLSHPTTIESYLQLAHIYCRKKQYSDAHSMLDIAFTAVGVSRDAPTYMIAQFYWVSGLLHSAEGKALAAHSDLENAFSCLKKLDRLYDDLTASVLSRLTGSLKRRGNMDEAEKLVNEVLFAYEKTGETNYKFEEKIYWAQYWLFAKLAPPKDSSKLSELSQIVERAIHATKQVSHTPMRLVERLGWTQTAYMHLKEPEKVDNTSLELLLCWNNESILNPRRCDADEYTVREATQISLPPLVTTLCNSLLERRYYPDNRMIGLSRLLKSYGDQVNAQIAVELCLTRDDGLAESPHPCIFCDLCSSAVPFGGPFLSCISCKNCDLHEACFPKYKELDSPLTSPTIGSSGCINHEFVRVPRDEWKQWDYETVDHGGQTLSQWLNAIRERYGGIPISRDLEEELSFMELLT